MGLEYLLRADFRLKGNKKLIGKIQNVSSELAELPTVISATWVTLVSPSIESLSKTAEAIYGNIYE